MSFDIKFTRQGFENVFDIARLFISLPIVKLLEQAFMTLFLMFVLI